MNGLSDLKKSPLIYLIAGEASGDVLGASLMRALRNYLPDCRFAGVGGALMQKEGLRSLFDMKELSLMGFVEVLPKIFRLKKRLNETFQDITDKKPDLVLTIDSPGFTLRILKMLKNSEDAALSEIPRVHWVAPQIWAWKEKRVKHYPGLWHKLLCLFPFEPEFFAKHQIFNTEFVGHPALENTPLPEKILSFSTKYQISPEKPFLLVLPGSRKNELRLLSPIFASVLKQFCEKYPDIKSGILAAPGVKSELEDFFREFLPNVPLIDHQDRAEAYSLADFALTKSGTATLELGIAGVPMVVAYKGNFLSALPAKYLLKIKHVALPNILAEEAFIPEFLQENCKDSALFNALSELIPDSLPASRQKKELAKIKQALTPPEGLMPSQAAALSVLPFLRKNNSPC